MRVFTDVNDPEVVQILIGGGVGVLLTDTLYGVVARADDEQAVSRVYRLKERNEKKSPIVLIASVDQVFDNPNTNHQQLLGEAWPGKVSVIIPSLAAPVWIRRDNDSVAYRLPADDNLRQLIEKTGPLIAPSANPEGEAPAMNIDEARKYFGDQVDFYVDSGQANDDQPSQLLRLDTHGNIERLR